MENVSKINEKAAAEALRILEEAWSYYQPEPLPASTLNEDQPELFQYHNAA